MSNVDSLFASVLLGSWFWLLLGSLKWFCDAFVDAVVFILVVVVGNVDFVGTVVIVRVATVSVVVVDFVVAAAAVVVVGIVFVVAVVAAVVVYMLAGEDLITIVVESMDLVGNTTLADSCCTEPVDTK